MASNSELIPVKSEGRLQGYRNLTRREHASWWRTRTWWTQALMWIAIIDGMLAMVLVVVPNIEAENGKVASALDGQVGLMMFFTMLGMAPAVGAVIIGQDAILDEKIKGTAGWLLSKPTSRTAFILSKITPNALGILVSMVILPTVVGFILFEVSGNPVNPLGLAAGALATYLSLIFYLALAILLGTLSNARGLAIGLPMGLIFGYQLFLGLAPWLANYTPWGLAATSGQGGASLAMSLAQGNWNANYLPAICTILYILALSFFAMRRFEKEEL